MDAGNEMAGPMPYLQVLVLVENPRICQQELGVPLAHIASRSDFGAFRLAGGCCSLSAASEWIWAACQQPADQSTVQKLRGGCSMHARRASILGNQRL